MRWFFGLICLFCLVPLANAQDTPTPKCLTLVYDDKIGASHTLFAKFFDVLYERAGLCHNSRSMTSNRKEQMLRTGEIDGDWLRVEGFAEQYPEAMIAVPQPIFTMPAHFFWLEASNFDGNPASLKGKRVGHPAGYRWIEWNLPKQEAIAVPLFNENTVWDLLTRGRIEVYVTSNMSADTLLAEAEKAGIAYRHDVWRHIPFFHILHRRHAAIVPKLNQALVDMIESGELAEILKVPGIRLAVID